MTAAPSLKGLPFKAGDTVVRGREVATVTYVSEILDYAEVVYPDGFAFRTAKSEWRRRCLYYANETFHVCGAWCP
jgi:hypothetical protein